MDAQADLYLCCSHMAKKGFLMMWLIYGKSMVDFIASYFSRFAAVHIASFGLKWAQSTAKVMSSWSVTH